MADWQGGVVPPRWTRFISSLGVIREFCEKRRPVVRRRKAVSMLIITPLIVNMRQVPWQRIVPQVPEISSSPSPTDATLPDERVLRALRRISRAIDQHSRRLSGSHQLTSPQLVCLRQLLGEGTWTPSRLAKEVSVSQPTVTGILDRLAKKGLVKRIRDELDRRRVLLLITEEGKALVAAAPSPLQERFAQQFALLETDEQRGIADVLERVVSMMEADAIDASLLPST